MKFNLKGRQQGKTTDLVQWATRAPKGVTRIIVVASEIEKTTIRHLIGHTTSGSARVMTVREVVERRASFPANTEVGIDELENVLHSLLHLSTARIAVVTATES